MKIEWQDVEYDNNVSYETKTVPGEDNQTHTLVLEPAEMGKGEGQFTLDLDWFVRHEGCPYEVVTYADSDSMFKDYNQCGMGWWEEQLGSYLFGDNHAQREEIWGSEPREVPIELVVEIGWENEPNPYAIEIDKPITR